MPTPHIPTTPSPTPTTPRSLSLSIVAAALYACLSVTAAMADQPLVKDLAGPADDFGWMRLPAPEQLAAGSKRVLIPVDFSGTQTEWRREIVADPEAGFRLIVLQPADAEWQLELQTPEGRWLGDESKAQPWRPVATEDLGLGLPSDGLAADVLHVTPTQSAGGAWVLSIQTPTDDATESRRGLVVVQNEGPWSLKLWNADLEAVVGRPLAIDAAIQIDSGSEPAKARDFFTDQLELTVSAADGSEHRWSRQDGNLEQVLRGADEKTGLDRLGFEIVPTSAGLHRVSLRLRGRDGHGSPIERTAEHAVYVVDPPFTVLSSAADRAIGAPTQLRVADADPRKANTASARLQIDIPVVLSDGKRAIDAKSQVYAELWGRDAGGLPVPVAWIGGMKYPNSDAGGTYIPLRFDARWIARAGAQPPYTLRNLRFQDPDSAVPFAEVDALALTGTAPTRLLSVSKALDIEPDEAMLQGPRPLGFQKHPTSKAAKGVPQETIVLVHGYCSGNLWYANRGAFPAPRRIFWDFGQARSNDQFALEILSQTLDLTHFSTVAHSQGGMASLHLYNYYWSGLDNSDAPRPLQSVGTPFLGSSLMMNQIVLQPIINLLGIKGLCDPVIDLTHAGAALWLANIPSSSRDKAYFYRTRGRDLVPCFWSSPIIPGRDDGVVSIYEGYLAGGHDLGIKNRQCHTDGMSHLFQLADTNRNVTMAANARIWLPDPIEACAHVTPSRPWAPAVTVLNGSCSTVQSGSISQYNWRITGPVTRNLTGQYVTTTLPVGGAYQVELTIHSTNPTLTDTVTKFVFLSSGPNDPL